MLFRSETKKRVELLPEEWNDDFGPDFYEHAIENGFYYVAPKDEWKSDVESIPAPGIKQFNTPSAEEVQIEMNHLKKGLVNVDE